MSDQPTCRIVVLASGAGSNLAALLEAHTNPNWGGQIVAVGSDVPGCGALGLAEQVDVPAFCLEIKDFPDRAQWDVALANAAAAYEPDLIVSAGFMRILGDEFLAQWEGKIINTHPALLPAFPGAHGVRDALEHGVKVTGVTVHLVDRGVDTGPIIAQRVVGVEDGDTQETLHERIKVVERRLLVEVVGAMARAGWRAEGRTVKLNSPVSVE